MANSVRLASTDGQHLFAKEAQVLCFTCSSTRQDAFLLVQGVGFGRMMLSPVFPAIRPTAFKTACFGLESGYDGCTMSKCIEMPSSPNESVYYG